MCTGSVKMDHLNTKCYIDNIMFNLRRLKLYTKTCMIIDQHEPYQTPGIGTDDPEQFMLLYMQLHSLLFYSYQEKLCDKYHLAIMEVGLWFNDQTFGDYNKRQILSVYIKPMLYSNILIESFLFCKKIKYRNRRHFHTVLYK